jgi:RNA polymerase subunit RPABC4/transcription elongation factor Spt4
MNFPSLDTVVAYATVCFSIVGALLTALWISLIIWTFRDMRARSRDPFAQILAALVVALLPGVGLVVYLILRPSETLAEAYERALEEEALLQEIEERPACPGCSRTVDPDWILCAHCHTRLRKACPDCNEMMDLHWTLCPHCGNNRVDRYRMVPSVANLVDSVADEGGTLESGEDELDDLYAKPGIEPGAEPPSGELQVPDPGDLT